MNYYTVKQQTCFLLLLMLVLITATACNDPESTPEPIVVANAEVFIFPGQTEKRLISDEKIPQDNCNGSAETSQTVTREHTVQYTLEVGSGLTVNAEGKVGIPGIGEVGLGAEVAAHYSVGYGRQETIGRAVTVAAAPQTYIQHTIQQFEVWDTGEVLIVAGEQNQRLPYSFRRDFSIEAVAPASIGCPGGLSSAAAAIPSATPNLIPPVVANPSSSSCPLIVIEGTGVGLPIVQTTTWAELSTQGTTKETQSSNINETCSRDADNQVQVWVGYWSTDPNYLDYRRTVSANQAIELVQQNPGQPVIIVPWGD